MQLAVEAAYIAAQDVQHAIQVCVLPPHRSRVCALAFSASHEHAASASADGTLHIDEVYSGHSAWTGAVNGLPTAVATSPGSTGAVKEVAVSTERGRISLVRKVCTMQHACVHIS